MNAPAEVYASKIRNLRERISRSAGSSASTMNSIPETIFLISFKYKKKNYSFLKLPLFLRKEAWRTVKDTLMASPSESTTVSLCFPGAGARDSEWTMVVSPSKTPSRCHQSVVEGVLWATEKTTLSPFGRVIVLPGAVG